MESGTFQAIWGVCGPGASCPVCVIESRPVTLVKTSCPTTPQASLHTPCCINAFFAAFYCDTSVEMLFWIHVFLHAARACVYQQAGHSAVGIAEKTWRQFAAAVLHCCTDSVNSHCNITGIFLSSWCWINPCSLHDTSLTAFSQHDTTALTREAQQCQHS